MKKTVITITLALLLSLLLASTTFAAPAAAEKQLPFKGSWQAVETYDIAFPTIIVHGSGSGNATHLGRYTVRYEAEVNIPTGAGIESAQFVAANGDSFFAEGRAQPTPTEIPYVITLVEMYTITGGTGRFAGATGSFTVERVLNQATGVSSGTINGDIVIP